MKVQMGHTISVHYVGTMQDGTEFDNSRLRDRPIRFEVGMDNMIPGFVNAVIGMAEGETRNVTLEPSEAYGPRDPNANQGVPRAAFGPEFDFEIGGAVQGEGPQGKFLATIQSYNDEEVILDLNHPLAGEALTFEIELMSIHTDDSEQKIVMSDWNASMRKAELLEVAKSLGLSVNTRSTKAQIIEALQAQ